MDSVKPLSRVSAQDGLLVRDLNSNGVIDDHSELFGTNTTDGFIVLRTLDSVKTATTRLPM